MAKEKTPWLKHRKYGARKYFGTYAFVRDESLCGNKRIFLLRRDKTCGKAHAVAFSSHEAAKKDGWVHRK